MQAQRFKVTLRCAEFRVPVECYVPGSTDHAARETAKQCAANKGLSHVEVVSSELDARKPEPLI